MEYICKRIEEYIPLDGNYCKDIWNLAKPLQLVKTDTGNEARQKTEVKVLWNSEYLYIAFKCEDDYIKASLTGYNDTIYNEDVVEVFIDDNKDLKTYIEVEVSPLNTVLHYFINNDLKSNVIAYAKVEHSVKSAVMYDTERKLWYTEIAIQLSEFVTAPNNPPVSGDSWGINFYRIDRGKDGYEEYSAWSYTKEINFHKPQYFGRLKFEK